jgi:hypothetical protein
MANYRKHEIVGKKIFLLTVVLIFISSFTPVTWARTKYALLIGINDYKISGLVSLQGPGNDVRLIKKVLLAKLQFEKENITILKDKNATHTGIEKAFSRLAQKIKDGDFVYIHYSGHGSQIPDKDGDEYPGEVDQTWVSYGSRSTIMKGKDQFDIPDDELYLWLVPIFKKTQHVVFVSDSCYSATVTRGDILTLRSVPPDKRRFPFLPKTPGDKDFNGGIRIGAVQDSGIACEGSFNGETHGLFSWYWAHALLQAQPEDTWGDVFKRASKKVTRHFECQRPQFHGDPEKPIFGSDPF